MAKQSGVTRNYSKKPSTLAKRQSEFQTLISTGDYKDGSLFPSGGFYVVHKDHKNVIDPKENKEMLAAEILARKGYRIKLMSEKSSMSRVSTPDGYKEGMVMDIKTINNAGKYRIERSLKNAAIQGAEVAVLVQTVTAMTRKYVEEQIAMYVSHAKGEERGRLREVIVVGLSGNVHRHKLKKRSRHTSSLLRAQT